MRLIFRGIAPLKGIIMNRLAFLWAGVLVLAGMQSTAHAITMRPSGPSTMSGMITLMPWGITCAVSGTAFVPDASTDGHPGITPYAHPTPAGPSHGHSATITSFGTTTPGTCASGIFSGFPYTVDVNGNQVTARGVFLSTPAGNCVGDLTGTFTHPSTVDFTAASLGGCSASGTITLTIDVDPTP